MTRDCSSLDGYVHGSEDAAFRQLTALQGTALRKGTRALAKRGPCAFEGEHINIYGLGGYAGSITSCPCYDAAMGTHVIRFRVHT